MKRSQLLLPALAMMLPLAATFVGCTPDDRQYMLTYDHPKSEAQIAAARSRQETRTTAVADQPAAAPTQPVIIETASVNRTPKVVTVAPTVAPAAPPPAPDNATAQTPITSVGSSIVAVPSAAPVVVAIKPPAAAPSLPPPPVMTMRQRLPRPSPALVRPPPPPPESVPAPPVQAVVVTPPQLSATVPAGMPEAEAGAAIISTVVPVSTTAEAHCRDVADQRKRDAAANEYDEELQQQVFDGTLKNCMDWAAQHPG